MSGRNAASGRSRVVLVEHRRRRRRSRRPTTPVPGPAALTTGRPGPFSLATEASELISTTRCVAQPTGGLQGCDVAGMHDVETTSGGDQRVAARIRNRRPVLERFRPAAAGGSNRGSSGALVRPASRRRLPGSGRPPGGGAAAATQAEAATTPMATASVISDPPASATATLAANRSPAPHGSAPWTAAAGRNRLLVGGRQERPVAPAVTQMASAAQAARNCLASRSGWLASRSGPPGCARPARGKRFGEVRGHQGDPLDRWTAAGMGIPDHFRGGAPLSVSSVRTPGSLVVPAP